MQDGLKELLPFLHDRNPQVRQIALTNLLGHTAKGSPNRDIFFAGIGGGRLKNRIENECIRDLKLLCRDQLAIAHDAFRALVNLSDNSLLAPSLSQADFLVFLVSYILNPTSILADLASMLLSNISSSPSACATLISLMVPVIMAPFASPPYYVPASQSGTSSPPSPPASGQTKDVLALPLMVQAFVQAAKTGSSPEQRNRKGELHFLASVFANVTTAPAGRMCFLTARSTNVFETTTEGELEYPLSQLVVFTEHQDIIRRGGVASTIKHCSFHAPAHKAILLPDTEFVAVPPSTITAPGINALPYILLPLAGPEEYDLEDQEKLHPALQLLPDSKKREPDEVLRLTHVETLVLLCTTRAGREYLRANGVYEIIRTLHLSEQSESVRDGIERLVNLLKGEEKPIEEGEGDGWTHGKIDSEHERREHETRQTLDSPLLRASASNEDSDDDKIVEV
ncbi:HGH1 [Sanghuangporus sanghuang]